MVGVSNTESETIYHCLLVFVVKNCCKNYSLESICGKADVLHRCMSQGQRKMKKNFGRIISVRTKVRKSRPLNARFRLQRLKESAHCLPSSFSIFSITNPEGFEYLGSITR
jgi:hypothetical protein